jgi:hypothetical protein
MVNIVWKSKPKTVIHLLEKSKDGYTFLETKKLDYEVQVFSVGKKTFKVQKDAGIWVKNHVEIYYDVNHAEALTFGEIAKLKRPEDLQNFMKSQGLDKLVRGNLINIYLIIIVGLIILLVITAGYGMQQLQTANNNLAELTLKYMNATTGGRIPK